MPDITATDPVIQPTIPEQVFDLWRIPLFRASWPNPAGPMLCEAQFQLARRGGDGVLIDGPARIWYRVPNLWEVASQDVDVANAVNALILAITKKARESGVI